MEPIFVIAVIGVGIAGYLLGQKAGKDFWKEHIQELAMQSLEEKIQEVRDLYEETYRNVLKHVVVLLKEEMNKTEK